MASSVAESTKVQSELKAPGAETATGVAVEAGAIVQSGELLLAIEVSSADMTTLAMKPQENRPSDLSGRSSEYLSHNN